MFQGYAFVTALMLTRKLYDLRWKSLYEDIPSLAMQLEHYKVRNSQELVSWLSSHYYLSFRIRSNNDTLNLRLFHYMFNIYLFKTQVKALKGHEDQARNGYSDTSEKVGVPCSEVCAEDFRIFIEDQKTKALPIEADVKDAKRRISSVKGPRKRKEVPVKNESDDSDDGNGSA